MGLFGSYEGNPAADPFGWKAWRGAVPVGTGGDQNWSLQLAESGDYLIRYTVDYEHEDPATGLPYQEKAYASITVTSVAAALDVPANPVNTEPIILDGSDSNHTAGVTLSWLWQVGGATNYNGCPDAETCTIPAETLNPGLHTVTLTLTNTDNGDQSTVQGTMDVLDGHLDIQVTPPSPDIGEVVTFDILGYPNDVVAAWDFGGPGCDPFTQQDICYPTYTDCLSTAFKYSTPGLKSVSVELTDPATGNFIGFTSFELTVQDNGTCDGCTFAVNPAEDTFSAEGGAGTFAVETQTDCVWTVTAPDPWITITDPGGGSGADSVSYLVDENANPPRVGAIQVRDLQHSLVQSGIGSANVASSMTGTAEPPAGETTTLWVTYGNDGPDDTLDTLISVEIPFGVPAGWTGLTAEILDDLQNSAAVLDAFGYPVSTTDDPLGNWPLLRLDDVSCDRLRFLVQGPDWVGEPEPTPVSGLAAGASSTWTFELPIPSNGVKIGQMEIIAGPSAGARFSPATTAITHTDAHGAQRFGSGLNCGDLVDGCSRLMDCFGPRLWQLEPPLVADLQVASDDGYGCEALQGFVAGRAALVNVGGCSYYEKADNAQAAGASAVIVVNDGQCSDGTTSDHCVMDMDGGADAGDIDVPVLMLSVADGQPIMDEVSGGGTVRIRLGNIPSVSFSIDSMAYHSLAENDPWRDDDGETFVLQGLPVASVFADGFDLGDLESWSQTTP